MADGHIVYQGNCKDSADYFRRIGYPITKYQNPADVFLKVLQVNYPKQAEDEEKIRTLLQSYD
jgi:hypothetical protein